MKKFLRKSLIYSLIFSIMMPVWLVTGALSAQKAEAADPIGPTITSYILDNPVISPNSDGVLDDVSIDLAFSEAVSVNLDITDAMGAVVRDIYSSSSVTNPSAKKWDGKNNGSVLVPDGVYTVRVDFTDVSDGINVIDESQTVTVDTQAPANVSLTVTTPVNYANQTSVAISAVSEPFALLDYTFEDNLGATVSGSQTADSSGNISIDDIDLSSLLDGVIDINYYLTDQFGNQSAEQSVATNKDATAPVITLIGSDSISVDQYSYYLDAGATADDNIDGDITAAIVTTSDVDTDIPGDYQVKYNASDSAGNPAIEVVRDVEVIESEIVTLSELEKEVAISSGATAGTIINIPLGLTDTVLDLSDLLVAGPSSQSVTLDHQIIINLTTDSGIIQVVIPAGTAITGSLTWDGKLGLPQIVSNDGKLLTISANTVATDILAIEIGLTTETLTFDQAVKIVFPDSAGSKIGFINSGVFTKISEACDDADAPVMLTDECKINSTDGKDLVVWTKHFTEFVTYSENVTLNSPVFSAVTSIENNDKYLTVSWKGVGGAVEKYEIAVNDVKNYVTANPSDLNQSYSFKLKVSDYGDYKVLVRSLVQNVYSSNTTYLTVTLTAPVTSVATIATVVEEPVAVPSIAPASAKAAEPQPEEIKVPSDDSGIIKGEESTSENEKTNWTPWIILFILIVLAGAATGGYFYWFAGRDEAEEESGKPVQKGDGPKVVVRDKGKTVERNKTKRW